MKLQSRLVAAFLGVVSIALLGAMLSLWQVQRLGRALYEVGVVRLPSLQGLMQMRDAAILLDESCLELSDPARDVMQRQATRQRVRATLARYVEGRAIYAPLPQTPAEGVQWTHYTELERRWRADLDALVAAVERESDIAVIASRSRALREEWPAIDSTLAALQRLNIAVADSAKAHTIASRGDLRSVMVFATLSALLAIVAAFGFAILIGRQLVRPMSDVARALTIVSRGETPARLHESGDEETRGVVRAMNSMIDSLRESEARFRSAMKNSPIGMAIVGPDGRWLEVNPALCQMVGRSREELLATTFAAITHPDDVGRDLDALRLAVDGVQEAWENEKRYVRPDGTAVWAAVHVSTVRDDTGRLVHFVSQMEDITASRAAQQAQRQRVESHARFARAMAVLTRTQVVSPEQLPEVVQFVTQTVADALEVTGVSVWRLRPDMHLERIGGGRRDGQGGVTASRPPTTLQIAKYRELYDQRFVQHEVYAAHDPASDPDAAEFYREILQPLGVRAYLRAHIRTQGRISGIVVASEVRAPRTWLPDEETFLASVANLLSAHMSQVEYQAAQAQVRQIEKLNAIGQLAGGVAHDFNNLLTVINGCSDLLSPPDYGDAAAREELIQAIRDAGTRASALTRQLLLFSRKATVEPRVLMVNEAFQDILRLLRRLIGEHIVLQTSFAPDLTPIIVDPGQLEQVVVNLAVNARDAMPTGGTMTIETRQVVFDDAWCVAHPAYRAGSFVQLTVRDTGEGIRPDVMAHIFEPFFTTKEAGRGTGLGLATVYGIVEQAGGFIAVESTVGVGSAFQVHFPAIVTAPTTDGAVDHARGPLRGTETILLVEDDRDVRLVARRLLTAHGYTVVEASRCEDAIEVLTHVARPVDLVLCDMVLPGMGGRETLEVLREFQPRVRVVFMSGYSDAAMLRGDAALRLLSKPFTADALLRAVRDALDALDAPDDPRA